MLSQGASSSNLSWKPMHTTHRIFRLHIDLVSAYDSVSVPVCRRIPHHLHRARVDGGGVHVLRLSGDLKKESGNYHVKILFFYESTDPNLREE